ncbi:MAG: carbohydrate ABC transporter permease [Firmicutes bacterium]|jgi:ABC-type glycerol-3-phosphate transport system permease component|nr:carbohydrate ABC transporter permease [Bacillota bacterium]
MKIQLRKKRLSRSAGGDFVIFLFLAAGAAFMSLPLVYSISQAFKPLNELFLFPPQFFVRNPTLDNFNDLLVLMGQSWVPISRYFFNSIFIVVFGMLGNVIFASIAAYTLSKHKFPGKKLVNEMIVLSLMFAPAVVSIPQYLVISWGKMINTPWAVIVPAWGSTLGLYLMRNFIEAMVDDSLLESARIDGASELRIYWQIVMPIVKPAWLTLIILVFQSLWATTGGMFIYAEQWKTLPYALNQIIAGGIARAGVAAAVTLVMMSVPIIVFVFNQSKIVETMGTSGLD